MSEVLQNCIPVMTELLFEGQDAVIKYVENCKKKYGKDGCINKDWKDYFITVSMVPFNTIIAATFVHRCNKVGLDLKKLRKSVMMRISETEPLLKKWASFDLEAFDSFKDILSLLQIMKAWTKLCCDAVSLGHIMSLVEVQRVLGIRYFINESAALQLFAYICERVRIKSGKTLPTTLEDLFNNPRVTPFLFRGGRPKTLFNCDEGITNWSDPLPSKTNISARFTRTDLAEHIYKVRNKDTMAQQIFDGKGRVTSAMVEQLKRVPLERYLERELKLPNPIHLEASVVRAASSLSGEVFTASDQRCWVYMRATVAYNPKLEKQFMEAFMNEWAPEVSDNS